MDPPPEIERDIFRAKVFVLVRNIQLIYFIQGDEMQPLNVKMELTSDKDIFFLYQTIVTEDRYKQIQES